MMENCDCRCPEHPEQKVKIDQDNIFSMAYCPKCSYNFHLLENIATCDSCKQQTKEFWERVKELDSEFLSS